MRSLRLLRLEWRGLTADALVWILVALFAGAAGYALWNGARWAAFQRTAITDAAREERDRHAAAEADIRRIQAGAPAPSPFADPRNADTAGRRLASRYAAMPPAPLAPLAIGQSDLLPSYFRMSTDARENVLAAAELENPHRLLAGRFDLAFVVVHFLPLLILALTYNLLSAEQEQGTLALALSQPISRGRLVLLKAMPRLLLVAALVIGCGLASALVSGAAVTTAAGLIALISWIAIVLLYGLFWFALALAVAVRDKPSAANAVLLAGAWVLFVMLVPSVLNLVAETWYPVPSRVRMVQAVREASDEASAAGSQLLARYYEDHPELAPKDAAGGAAGSAAMTRFTATRVAVADDVERRVRPVLAEYARQAEGQRRVIARLRYLSPAALLQETLNDLAGAGAARHRQFVAQVEAYHAAWRAFFQPRVLRRQLLTDYRDVPAFQYREEPVGALLSRTLVTAVGLGLPACALGWWTMAGLRRRPRGERLRAARDSATIPVTD